MIEIQTVLAAVKRLLRLKIGYTAVEHLHFVLGNVRRIGNDDIKLPKSAPERRVHDIGLHGQQTTAHAQITGVLAGNVQRTVRQVDRGHAGILDRVRRREMPMQPRRSTNREYAVKPALWPAQ